MDFKPGALTSQPRYPLPDWLQPERPAIRNQTKIKVLYCILVLLFHVFLWFQLEERAMEELLQYYGGKDNACEVISVERIPSTAAKPVWRKERSPSLSSN